MILYKDEEQERQEDGSLKGDTVEGEPMSFLHLRETFHSARIDHDDIRP